MRAAFGTVLVVAALAQACVRTPAAPDLPRVSVDTARALADLGVLAADSMEGRGTGTLGIERARRFLLSAFQDAGVEAFAGGYEREFQLMRGGQGVGGVNLVGYIAGTEADHPVIVVTAHYDHLGVRDGVIYNGADDNASGTAALLALARHLAESPPAHTVVLAALDGEELGLRGAEAFLAEPPVGRERIALNVNLDMVGRNAAGELFAAGTHHSPSLRPILEEIAADSPVRLRLGHDSPALPPADDWTQQSDHGVFHKAGIPFVYFGVEDHPDYHRPTDDTERIEPAFFAGAVETIIRAVELLDARLEEVEPATPVGSGTP